MILSIWGTEWLLRLRPEGIPRLDEVGVDWSVVVFTGVLAVVTGILFGLLPALQLSRPDVTGVLKDGGTSLDAVTAAVTVLEDSPLFNAARGAVFNCAGRNELDAAVMNGETLDAGAVAGLRTARNPILLARLVLERSPHVLLIGDAPGDYRAAEANGCLFFPINPGHEEESWRQFVDEGCDRFLSGRFAVATTSPSATATA